jgi:hypothetical protein
LRIEECGLRIDAALLIIHGARVRPFFKSAFRNPQSAISTVSAVRGSCHRILADADAPSSRRSGSAGRHRRFARRESALRSNLLDTLRLEADFS